MIMAFLQEISIVIFRKKYLKTIDKIRFIGYTINRATISC